MGLLLTITEPRATAACIYVASLACPRKTAASPAIDSGGCLSRTIAGGCMQSAVKIILLIEI